MSCNAKGDMQLTGQLPKVEASVFDNKPELPNSLIQQLRILSSPLIGSSPLMQNQLHQDCSIRNLKPGPIVNNSFGNDL